MPRYGTIKRQYPRVEVLRGYDPNEPRTKTQAFPVKSGVTISSGQVISLAWDAALSQYEWVLGVTGTAMPYIALADSRDEDVQEADKLPALSVAGDFEIQTAFFKAGDTYNVDVPITFDGVTGDLKATTAGSGAAILGFITRNHGVENLAGKNSNAVNLDVVTFQTSYQLNPA